MLPLLVLAAADAIVMDGDFNDWDSVTNTMCVDAFDAAAGGPDLGTTKWTANGDTLHLWLELCAKDGPMLHLGGPQDGLRNAIWCNMGTSQSNIRQSRQIGAILNQDKGKSGI